MKVTADQAHKILTGNNSFSQLGFSMLITRWRRVYRHNASPTTVEACLEDINSFMQKYAVIMSDDYATISKL